LRYANNDSGAARALCVPSTEYYQVVAKITAAAPRVDDALQILAERPARTAIAVISNLHAQACGRSITQDQL